LNEKGKEVDKNLKNDEKRDIIHGIKEGLQQLLRKQISLKIEFYQTE
jgi:hypothetical protein